VRFDGFDLVLLHGYSFLGYNMTKKLNLSLKQRTLAGLQLEVGLANSCEDFV